jgi:outer membrane autotransporter protein
MHTTSKNSFHKKLLVSALQNTYAVRASALAVLFAASSFAAAPAEISSFAELVGSKPADDIVLVQGAFYPYRPNTPVTIDGNFKSTVNSENFHCAVNSQRAVDVAVWLSENKDLGNYTVKFQNFGVITDGENGIPVSAEGGISGLSLSDSTEFLRTTRNTTLDINNVAFTDITSTENIINSIGDNGAKGTVLFTHNYVGGLTITSPSTFMAVVEQWYGDLIVDSSLFENMTMDRAGVINAYGGDVFTQITNSKFTNISNSANAYSGVLNWTGDEGSNLTIIGSEFTGNRSESARGASVYAKSLPGSNLIENTVFSGNTSKGYGGAITIYNGYSQDAVSELTIKDSTFTNNVSYASKTYRGGALAFMQSKGLARNAQLNILAENSDTVFSGNGTFVSDDAYSSDALFVYNADINLSAAEGRKVVFDDSIYGYNSDGSNTVVNINKPDLEYSYVYQDADGSRTTVTKTAPAGGEVRFNDSVYWADIHTYGGTVSLLAPEDADRTAVYENTRLKTSHLTVEADTVLNLQDETPVTEAAFNSMQEAEIVALTMDAHLQKVYLGDELTLNGNLFVQPAVNLETATSDTFTVGGGAVTSTGGKILVNGWIVTADKASNTVVNVNLADDGDEELKSHFGLASGGEKAYGPVYVWDVKYAGDGTYEFVRREPEPFVYDNETPTPYSDDPVPVLTEDKPTDYNPDVYAGQVVSLALSVVQHAISDTVFSETGVGSLGFLNPDEKPERKEWWGKVLGADLDLDTKNFHKIDMDYAIGMVGHQFDPIKTGIGDIEFGAYLGAASARARYSISKIRQNGAFAGGSVLYKNGHAWAGAHANIGVMSNHLKGLTDNRASTPWIGVGASVGYSFEFPAARLAVTPMVDVSYVQVKSKDFTTDLGADVKNSRTHSFEVSPGLRIDKQFNNGWTAGFNARYAFVTKHDGKTTAQYAGDELHALPTISNKNYAEYGLSVKKQSKNLGFGLMLNRNDGGRRGWSGMARVSYSF